MKKCTKSIQIILGIFILASDYVQAKFIATNHDDQIQEALGKYIYTIICVADQNEQSAQDIKMIKKNFRIASDSRLYAKLLKKDICFLFVEMNDKNAAEIKTILDIQFIPGCALFAQTKKLIDLQLSENPTSLTFLDILDNNLHHEIHDLQEKREDEEAQARQERIDQEARYGFYPYYQYYYDPYWYNGPYWGTWGWSGGRAAWGSNRGNWNHRGEYESHNHTHESGGHKK